jgi:hypothetical protein
MITRNLTIAPSLVPDPGRPKTPILISRVLKSEFQGRLRRLGRTMGFVKLDEVVSEDWAIPDSEFAKQAIAVANELSPPFMMRHCFRSYCFGAILASRNNLKLDREVFFVAAMLHDLGLTETHADDPGSFEWVGAKLAHQFCLDAGREEVIAATVHNSIALHTSVGIADQYAPEIALLHFGTGMDLFGMRIEEVPGEVLDCVLSDHPRLEFRDEMAMCLNHQANLKPCCHFAGAAKLGIVDRIQEELVR